MNQKNYASSLNVIWCGPFPADRNGIDEYARTIVSRLHSSISVSYARLCFTGWPKDYPLQVIKAAWSVIRQVRHRKRSVIHIHSCPFSTGPGAVLIAVLGRVLGFKVVTTVHEDRSSFKSGNSKVMRHLYPPLERVVFALSGLLIVHSRWQAQQLPASVRQKARVVEFGVTAFPEGPATISEGPLVGCFGLVAPYKGIETVIDACGRASDTVPGLRLVVAGTLASHHQGYAQKLREMIADALGDRGQLLLNVPGDRFDELYQEAAIVAFGLRRVTQSTTFYRALGHHRPVVVTDVGGVVEIVRREGVGMIVPVDDAAAMAEAIAKLVVDKGSYEAAREAIRRFAAARTWAANAREHAATYRDLLLST